MNSSPMVMKISTKRRLTFMTIALFNFFTGVEYAVIIPSLWGYISERFNAPSYMLGLIIASFSMSGLFSNPLIGKWADKYPNTRVILLVTNMGEIIGSFLYFIGISTWFLVLSRLVCGIGVGGGSAMMADITKSTPLESRTGTLSIVMATRQFGLLVGPAVNIFFLSLDYQLGPFRLDKYTAPGLFMCVIWIILQIFFLFIYFNLTELKRMEQLEQHLSVDYGQPSLIEGFRESLNSAGSEHVAPSLDNSHNTLVKSWPNFLSSSGSTATSPIKSSPEKNVFPEQKLVKGEPNSMIESAEQFICSAENSSQPIRADDQNEVVITRRDDPMFQEASLKEYQRCDSREKLYVQSERNSCRERLYKFAREYLRDEIVVLLGLVFASVTAQTTMEAITTPLTKELFNYEEFENSLLFLIAAVETLIVFAAITLLSKKISDRALLLIGQIVLCAAVAWLLAFVPFAKPNDFSILPYYIIGAVLDLIAIPVLLVCSASLISKITSPENQALTHGLRRSVMSIACIIGPLWGGAFLKYRIALFAVPLGISLIFIVLFAISYKDLQVPASANKIVVSTDVTDTAPNTTINNTQIVA